MAGLLQRYGEARVGQRVVRGQRSQSQCRSDGGFELLCVSQGANQAVMRLDVAGIGGDGRAVGLRRACGVSGSEQVQTLLRMIVAVGWLGFRGRGHIFIVTSCKSSRC